MALFPNSHIIRYWGLDFNIWILGNTIQLITKVTLKYFSFDSNTWLLSLAASVSFFFFNFYFIYFYFMAVLGLRFCVRAFSSCDKQGPLFITVHGLLTIAASLVAEHRLQTRRLSNCGSQAQSLRGMWDLPRPRLEPVSPALAGRFSTTVPPGKPSFCFLIFFLVCGSYFSASLYAS